MSRRTGGGDIGRSGDGGPRGRGHPLHTQRFILAEPGHDALGRRALGIVAQDRRDPDFQHALGLAATAQERLERVPERAPPRRPRLGRRDHVVGGAQPAGQRADQAHRDLGLVAQRVEEAVALDHLQDDVAQRARGGAAERAIDHAHLAEHLAGAQERQAHAPARAALQQLDLAAHDQVCVARALPLVKDDVAVCVAALDLAHRPPT